LNTLVVEDPHWIFPGEELRLIPPDTTKVAVAPQATGDTTQPQRAIPATAGTDTSQSAARAAMIVPPVAAPPPPPPSTESAPSIFRPKPASLDAVGGAERSNYRPVFRGDFYSAGFLTENATFPWANVLGAAGRTTLRNLTSSSSARPFEQ